MVATHEAGHAVVRAALPQHSPPIERITIQSGDVAGALGYVRYEDPGTASTSSPRGASCSTTCCVLMGGREAEPLLLDDLSIGSSGDLQRATEIARALVEVLGMGGETTGVRQYRKPDERRARPHLSDAQRAVIDRRVTEMLEEARQRAVAILRDNRTVLETLRDMLLEHKTIEAKALAGLVKK